MFAGNFAPAGWAFCDGHLLPISENDALFNLIGTTYGGDGQSTFALPDLRSRIPIHAGNGFLVGEAGGAEEITLTVNQIPAHNHVLLGTSADAVTNDPSGKTFAASFDPVYAQPGPLTAFAPQAIGQAGGSQPHTNLQPYLCVHFIISLFGIFPSVPQMSPGRPILRSRPGEKRSGGRE
jgi:microcystin-dependent protein